MASQSQRRHRRVVRAGYADTKGSSITSRYTRQWLCLTENELLFFKDHGFASSNAEPMSSITCRDIASATRVSSGSRSFCFRLEYGQSSRRVTVYLAFKSDLELQGWLDDVWAQRRPILVIGPTPVSELLLSSPVSGGPDSRGQIYDDMKVPIAYDLTTPSRSQFTLPRRSRIDLFSDSENTTPSSSPDFGAFSPPSTPPATLSRRPSTPSPFIRRHKESASIATTSPTLDQSALRKSKSKHEIRVKEAYSSSPSPSPSPAPSPGHSSHSHSQSHSHSRSSSRGHSHSSSRRETMTDDVRDYTGFVTRSGVHPISSGSFADLWKGELSMGSGSRKNVVAIKAIRTIPASTSAAAHSQSKHLQTALQTFQQVRHKHVLAMLGVCHDIGHCTSVISPWVSEGNASTYFAGKEMRTTLVARLSILGQVALGLQYLHSFNPPLIHGNLKAANVLINDHGEAVLSDYGLPSVLAASAGPTFFTSSAFASSVRWMAFELLRLEVGERPVLSAKCDMWSFGSLMLEILTDRVPYHYIRSDKDVVHEIMRGVKPSTSAHSPSSSRHGKTSTSNANASGIPPDISMFIESCWADRPSSRPSAGAAVLTIKRLRDERLGLYSP